MQDADDDYQEEYQRPGRPSRSRSQSRQTLNLLHCFAAVEVVSFQGTPTTPSSSKRGSGGGK